MLNIDENNLLRKVPDIKLSGMRKRSQLKRTWSQAIEGEGSNDYLNVSDDASQNGEWGVNIPGWME